MFSRFLNLFRRKRLDEELDLEFSHHLDSQEAEYLARGLSADEARRAARRDFGGWVRIREAYRDERGVPVLEVLGKNIRFSLRSCRRTPAATFTVIATLAIGIGANIAIFSVVNGVLLKPLPYPEPERLFEVSYTAPGLKLDDLDSSPFLFFTGREENRTLEGVGLWELGTANVTGLGEPEQVRRLLVTSEILPLLGVQPQLGRFFSAQEDLPETPPTVLLTHGYWQRRFGGDSSIVGRQLIMDGQPRTVIGVMPKGFRFLDRRADVLYPYRLNRDDVIVGNYYWSSIARLKPGVTLEQAEADFRRMIPIAIDRFPLRPGITRTQVQNTRLAPVITPLKQDVVGDVGNTLWLLMGTIGAVLLIACANVANLLLVRAEARQQELSIRAALGAGWSRIAGELLTESLLLGLAGGMLGIGFAYAGLQLLVTIGPGNLPRMDEISIDTSVLLFAVVVSVLSGLLFGLIPVLRHAKPRLVAALQSGGRSLSWSRERHRARGGVGSRPGCVGAHVARERGANDSNVSATERRESRIHQPGRTSDRGNRHTSAHSERS